MDDGACSSVDWPRAGAARRCSPTPRQIDEREGRVSPDGKRIAYVSDRESDDGDVDLWIAELALGPRDRVNRTRVTRVRGLEGFPSWAPDARVSRSSRSGRGCDPSGCRRRSTASRARCRPGRERPVRGRRRSRCSCRAAAARPRGRLTADASRLRTFRRPNRPTTAIPSGTTTIRRRCLPGRMPSGCGRWTRRCPSMSGRARSSRPRRARSNSRRVRSRLGDAAAALLRGTDHPPTAWQELRTKYRPQAAVGEGRGGRRIGDRCDDRRAAADQAGAWSRRARSSCPAIRSRRAPAPWRSSRAATSSMPRSPCRSRSVSSSPKRPASAATAWRSCS